jgi:hypothetical protein
MVDAESRSTRSAQALAAALAGLLALALPAAANPTSTVICGDFDGDGRFRIFDALLVLQAAVGMPAELLCPCVPCFVTSSTIPHMDHPIDDPCDEIDACQRWPADEAGEHLQGGENDPGGAVLGPAGDGHAAPRAGRLSVPGIECGDLDANGKIGARDALKILWASVGIDQGVTPHCPCDHCSVTTTTTSR